MNYIVTVLPTPETEHPQYSFYGPFQNYIAAFEFRESVIMAGYFLGHSLNVTGLDPPDLVDVLAGRANG